MKNLTTPQAILCGLGLIALAIASVPYSSQIVKPAYASNGVNKIAICNPDGIKCVRINRNGIFQNRTN
ncbi:hypothetical protein OAU49_02785 [Alphaproteobacteria bacterium]|nr:hypothetical protein [Alphaproteobacteria bacterium]